MKGKRTAFAAAFLVFSLTADMACANDIGRLNEARRALALEEAAMQDRLWEEMITARTDRDFAKAAIDKADAEVTALRNERWWIDNSIGFIGAAGAFGAGLYVKASALWPSVNLFVALASIPSSTPARGLPTVEGYGPPVPSTRQERAKAIENVVLDIASQRASSIGVARALADWIESLSASNRKRKSEIEARIKELSESRDALAARMVDAQKREAAARVAMSSGDKTIPWEEIIDRAYRHPPTANGSNVRTKTTSGGDTVIWRDWYTPDGSLHGEVDTYYPRVDIPHP